MAKAPNKRYTVPTNMDIKLYNTLSKKVETFAPQKPGAVSMYHCGPTVYDVAHIGNLRSYVFADILRRVFEYNKYSVNQVINITDVGHLVSDGDDGEDKMTKALKREGKPISVEAMLEVADMYAKKFVADITSLGIEMPHSLPKASGHIAEDLEIIKKLEESGYVYKISDGMYFDVSKFSGYGKLGGVSTGGEADQSRIHINPEKKHLADFAVWKFDPALGWESPWGRGFPGWHIECSAMSRKYLGQPFDIHTGGIDHIPVHHNNEIAQSEAAFGELLATYWMHNDFVNFGNAKMAKSAGGTLTLDTLKDQTISPLAYRYWLLTAHYRTPVNFTLEAVQGAQNALIRLMSTVGNLGDGGTISVDYRARFQAFINDNLDTPKAVALVWDILKDSALSDADKRATILDMDRVLGLNLGAVSGVGEEVVIDVPAEIAALVEAREDARKEKDWEKADALRKEIEERGFTIVDGKDGIKILAK